MKVCLVIGHMSRHDAVGTDTRLLARELRMAGVTTHIYAEECEQGFDFEHRISLAELHAALYDSQATIIYQWAVYWHRLKDLLDRAKARFVVRYHNMTPPEFFVSYDHHSFVATHAGYNQLRELGGHPAISALLCDSAFNLQEWERQVGVFAKPKLISAPYFELALERRQKARSDTLNILFVGRNVPNKGHQHMIGVLSAYHELYDRNIQLTAVGGMADTFRIYHQEIADLAVQSGVEKSYFPKAKVSNEELAALFDSSDVFLCVSEHEGFCVPIVEAQERGLPVIAYAATAVGETLGEGGLVSKTLDYDWFASAINHVARSESLREHLVAAGKRNTQRFKLPRLTAELVSFLSSIDKR